MSLAATVAATLAAAACFTVPSYRSSYTSPCVRDAHAVYVCFGEKYSAVTYATLIPICVGFALAAGGDPKFEQTGFILAVTSACCLVAVNTISRRTLAFYRSLVGPLQVQAWATSGSFFLLLVPWVFTGTCSSTC